MILRNLISLLVIGLLSISVLSSCGGSGDRSESTDQQSSSVEPVSAAEAATKSGDTELFTGFDTLPEDRALPGEELDTDGHVIPSTAGDRGGLTGVDPLTGEIADGSERNTSVATSGGRYATGVLRIGDAGSVSPLDTEGLSLAADPAGETPVAHALYRLTAGNAQPSLLTTDINLDSGEQFWLALADYGTELWQFKGPFTDGRMRIALDSSGGSDYISGAGNVLLAVVTESEDGIEITGVGAELADTSDTEAPAAPSGLDAAAAAGGVYLTWEASGAADLAGYRIYHNSAPFTGKLEASSTGVVIAGRSDHFIKDLPETESFFRVATVDTNGNESDLSGEVSATPGGGSAAAGALTVSRVAGRMGDAFDLDAGSISADSYDWDLDGDGTYELTGTGDAAQNGVQFTNGLGAPATGLFRPAVRARNAGGEVIAFSAVSTIIVSNFRPSVNLVILDPDDGNAPLEVNARVAFDDPDGVVVDVIWDTDGDVGLEPATRTTDQSGVSSSLSYPENPIIYPDAGLVRVSVRVTDDNDAVGWGHAFVEVGANRPPDASFTVTKPNPLFSTRTGGEEISFDASASSDPDGSISQYLFDPEGDGTFTFDSALTEPTSPMFDYEYNAPGIYTATVKVVDDSGNETTSSRLVTVRRFTNYSIASTGDPLNIDGQHIGASMGCGHPRFLYHNFANQSLDHTLLFNPTSSNPSERLSGTVDDSGNVGKFVSLDPSSARRGAYYDESNGDLKFAYAGRCDTVNMSTQTVDSTGDVGQFTSTMNAGGVGISYYDVTNGNLKYAHNPEFDGSGNWELRNIDTGAPSDNDVGQYAVMTVVDNRPAVCYYDADAGDLKFAVNDDFDGLGAWNVQVVDNTGDTGGHCQILEIDSRPAITYFDFTNTDNKFALNSEPDGSGDWEITTLPINGSTGFTEIVDFQMVQDRPTIIYDSRLRILSNTEADASGTWELFTVNFLNQDTRYSKRILDLGDRSGIVYHDNENNEEDLKFAVPTLD